MEAPQNGACTLLRPRQSVTRLGVGKESAEQDLVHAYAWFAVASHQGLEEASPILKHLLAKLSEDEQKEARALAAQFIEHFVPR